MIHLLTCTLDEKYNSVRERILRSHIAEAASLSFEMWIIHSSVRGVELSLHPEAVDLAPPNLLPPPFGLNVPCELGCLVFLNPTQARRYARFLSIRSNSPLQQLHAQIAMLHNKR